MLQNPQAMQNMMQMMGQAQQMPANGPAASPMAAMMGQNPQMAQMMAQLMGGASPSVHTPGQPPAPMDEAMQRNRFASQLAQLSAMGFNDEVKCLAALLRTNGNVDGALDVLFSS